MKILPPFFEFKGEGVIQIKNNKWICMNYGSKNRYSVIQIPRKRAICMRKHLSLVAQVLLVYSS